MTIDVIVIGSALQTPIVSSQLLSIIDTVFVEVVTQAFFVLILLIFLASMLLDLATVLLGLAPPLRRVLLVARLHPMYFPLMLYGLLALSTFLLSVSHGNRRGRNEAQSSK
jgi:hypothetical protein